MHETNMTPLSPRDDESRFRPQVVRRFNLRFLIRYLNVQKLPLYGRFPVFAEVGICSGERFGSEETGVGGKGRRMRRFDDEMARAVDVRAFVPRVVAPEDEDDMFALFGKFLYRRVGELFPAFALVRAGYAGSHRERRIQKQHTLLRPARQIGIATHRMPEVGC